MSNFYKSFLESTHLLVEAHSIETQEYSFMTDLPNRDTQTNQPIIKYFLIYKGHKFEVSEVFANWYQNKI